MHGSFNMRNQVKIWSIHHLIRKREDDTAVGTYSCCQGETSLAWGLFVIANKNSRSCSSGLNFRKMKWPRVTKINKPKIINSNVCSFKNETVFREEPIWRWTDRPWSILEICTIRFAQLPQHENIPAVCLCYRTWHGKVTTYHHKNFRCIQRIF